MVLKRVLLSCLLYLFFPHAGSAQTQSAPARRIAGPIDDSALVTLRGNVHPLAQAQFDRGAAPVSMPAQRLLLVLRRSPQQQMQLEQYLASLQDRNSPSFRKFLTPEQFGQRFGVATEDIQQISSWLSNQGFWVTRVAKGNMAIEFSGSVGQVEAAFHTQIHRFAVNGEEHVANISDPMIPAALAPVVAGVSQLNDFYPRPQLVRGPKGRWDATQKRFIPELTITSSGSQFLFVGPGDASTIYDAPNAQNTRLAGGQTTLDGTGVTIGIAGFEAENA